MRYSIDWKKYNAELRSRGRKCIGRFPRSLLKAKIQQLLREFCHQCLVNGERPITFQITPRWFSCWEAEFGVATRKPNRKYKVPKWCMAERLEIMWLNVARVRALCMAIHGYDPEMENWDQSPYHNNESGSVNAGTLAVAGSHKVPLIEGHADTRERWTGNFTTFSDTARIMAEGPPYCELMFKAGHIIELRLREYCRSRGFGPWVSVATSPKGSYRIADVLNFLERHLPDMSASRQWRIIMADDYAPHLTPHVFRLCWSRGYVFIPHGGGTTPVAQTPDTDLNQHVRRQYVATESFELLRQMRAGVPVPVCKHEQCVDMMVEVMSNLELHLQAAGGYKKTGLRVKLDGTEDDQIVREAQDFWNELGMRRKIDAAVAEVREEVQAGRLKWTFRDVQRLIRPYPARKEVDRLIEKMHDDTWIVEGEATYEKEAAADADAPAEEAEGAHGDTDDDTTDEEHSAVAEEDEDGEEVLDEGAHREEVEGALARSARSGGCDAGDAPELPTLTDGEAEMLERSQKLIETYEEAMEPLVAQGAITSVVCLENDIRKERRRMRNLTKENPQVMVALARARDAKEAEDLRQRRMVEELNAKTKTKADLDKQIKDAAKLLKKRKKDVLEAEMRLESKHVIKSFSVEFLGQNHARGGGAAGRKRRFEVLDRLARLGAGLSAPQKNDWTWFKEAWDEKMLEEHEAEWGGVFAGWTQKVLNDLEGGAANALSLFVHAETCRCFGGVCLLRVP